MKILGISLGSPNGSNDCMCKEALMGAKEVGAEVEFIHALDLDIKHCTGCCACSIGLVTGKGNRCILNDDFNWLLDKIYDADGIFWSIPIFEKGASGLFHTITDRFGPRMDRGMNVIATKIGEETGAPKPDPRFLQDKVTSYIGIGGSDWATRVQCDAGMQALTPMWKVIDNAVYPWSKTIIMDDKKVAEIRQYGRNLAEAAKDMAAAKYQGEPGVCPHCHSRNFFLDTDATKAVCCLCGAEGEIKVENGKLSFHYPEIWETLAHDTLTGKFKHADDIRENEGRNMEIKKTDAFKARVQTYKEFISPTVPDRK